MAQKEEPAGDSEICPAKKKRSAGEWTVICVLLVFILGGAALETSSRLGFQKSLERMQLRVSAPGQTVAEPMKVEAADKLVSGWPRKTISEIADGQSVEYRWRSLFYKFVIRLRVSADGTVVALDTNLPDQPDVVPLPPMTADLRPVKYISGLSAGAAPGFALNYTIVPFRQLQGEQWHLVRELVRQAVLIAARDELSLPTRDKVLNEPLPNDPEPALTMVDLVDWNIVDRHVKVTLTAPTRQGVVPPIKFDFDVPAGGWLEELTIKTESMSTTEFLDALKTIGFTGAARQFSAEGAVAEAIQDDLARFDMLSQFAAVRALHTEIAVLGESPDRLAALSRGYANLGSLTEYMWSPIYKAFAARGLLYAERLLRKDANRARALQNRAYARALVGLHASALADLAAASALPAAGDVPAWGPAIEAFCRGDSPGLVAILDRGSQAALPAYLNLLLASASESPQFHLEAARRILAVAPDCLPAYEVLLHNADLGVLRQATAAGPANLHASLRARLGTRDYIPEGARKLMSDRSPDAALDMKLRAELVQALRTAERLGTDVGEPSLGTLATLIQEASFVHELRVLQGQGHLGLDSAEVLAAARPIVKGHPFEAFFDVHVQDQVAAAQAMGRVMRIVEESPVEPSTAEIIRLYMHYKPWGMGNENLEMTCDRQYAGHSDPIFPDLVRILRMTLSAKVKTQLSATLREVSPYSPAGVAAAVAFDWDRVSASAIEWERQYHDSAEVIKALGDRYVALDQFEDAERCLKRWIELVPEHNAFKSLAELYQKHGDDELWVETMTASLKVPSYGLDDDESRVALATYFMRRKEWEKARPHAETAAQSYAAWALTCAADLYELTGDFKKAEALHRANAERYEQNAAGWYYFCRRTGHGDLKAARAQIQEELERLREFPSLAGRSAASILFTLDDQPELALKAMREGLEYQKFYYYILMGALRADELHQVAVRDEILKMPAGVIDNRYVEFKNWVRRFVAAPDAPLDRKLLDWAIREGSDEGGAAAKFYMAGSFLAAHGREEEARDYLQQAATSNAFRLDEANLAAYALRKRGVTVGEWRAMDFSPDVTKWLNQVWRAQTQLKAGKWEASVASCTKLIEEAPDFPDAYEQRHRGYLKGELLKLALADINRAHELLPTCAQFLAFRAQVNERLGNYQAAIDDYEGALQLDPDYARAHYDLAFLRAACPDAQFRSGREALAHAQRAFDSGEIPKPLAFSALAVAAAEAGDFGKAVQLQNLAISAAPEDSRDSYRQRRTLFQEGKAYRRKPEWWKG